MSEQQVEKISVKKMAIIILIAIVTAVVVTLLQTLILKHSNAAITGGVVGAVTTLLAFRILRKSATG